MSDVLARIRHGLGPGGWVEDPAALAPRLTDSRREVSGRCLGLARPGSVAQVAETVRLAASAGIPVVPQGGNTGRVNGAVPDMSGQAILLSVERLDNIREIDAAGFFLTAEAGCILADVQRVAREAERHFPLSLGAEGTCQIGGVVSTNAGGIAVLKYGNMRDLVLGVEAVLPDGRIWHGLNRLRKNNTGFDLKQLFIGGEGTVGVVTAAALKLFPAVRSHGTALVGVADAESALALLSLAKEMCPAGLSSFELISAMAVTFALKNVPAVRYPLATTPPWTLLVEVEGSQADDGARKALEHCLAVAFERKLVLDAAVATSDSQRGRMWHLREAIVEEALREATTVPTDVAVPIHRVPAFLAAADRAVESVLPGARPYPFGHFGDGNIHYNICIADGGDPAVFGRRRDDLKQAVEDVAAGLDGTFSAEHGVGSLKTGHMTRYKDSLEIELMRRVKNSLDPAGLMNPGKMLPA